MKAANSFHFYFQKDLVWKDFVERGYVIAGSAKTVRDRLREAITNLRCGHLIVFLQFGSMPKELARKNTELFAHDVMPQLRDLWSEWEDEWSPRALPDDERRTTSP